MAPWVAVVQFSLGFTMIMMAVLGTVAYTRKQIAGAIGFILMCVGVLIWAGIYILELRAGSIEGKFLFFRLKYIGVLILVGSLPAFALTFRRIFRALGQTPNYFLGIFPLLSFLIILTSDRHPFFINNLRLDTVGPFTILVFDQGPWFTINLAYSLIMVVLAMILIAIQARSTNGVFRYQMNYLFAGILIPWIVGLLASMGWFPVKGLDVTPISFSLSMPFLAIGVFRHRILSIIPVARGIIFERMAEGVLVLDNWYRVVDFNLPVQRLFELPELSKTIGKNAQEILGNYPKVLDYLVSGDFNPQDLELSGSMYEVSRHLLHDQRNFVVGQFILFRDITAHYEMESAVQRSEAQYRSIWEHASEGIFIVQGALIKLANPEIGRIIGLDPKTLTDRPVRDLLPPKEQAELLKAAHCWLEDGTLPERYETRIMHADGSPRDVDVKASWITYADQPAFLLFIRDITQSKQDEQRLIASEERYRITSELITDFAYATKVLPDTSLVGEWATSAYGRIAQQPIEELDAFSNLTSLTEPEDYPLVQTHIKRLLDGLADVCEFRIRDKNGDLRWIRNYCRPILDDKGGRVVRLVGAAQDLTERKLMEDDLRQAKLWVQQETIARSEFLMTMSQEIHAPLNAISGLSQLMQSTALTSEQQDYLDVIYANVEALHILFNDILDYSKVEAGAITLELQPSSLRECIEEVLVSAAPNLANKSVYLGYVIEPGVPEYPVIDAFRVRQVLENIVSFAMKHTDVGEIIVRVSSKTIEYSNVEITFSISNCGSDLPVGILEDVFRTLSDPAISTSKLKRSVGLGLALTSRLCAMMGGDFRVNVATGNKKGTTYIAKIQAAHSSVQWKPEFIKNAEKLRGKKVLFVGTPEVAKEVFQTMLQPLDVTMAFASGLAQAEKEIQQLQSVDLMLIGSEKGHEDALAVGKSLKQMKGAENAPQIWLCGFQAEAKDPPGFAGYLPCPVQFETLLVTLTTVISGTNIPRRLRRIPTDSLGEDFALKHPHTILLADENRISRNICVRTLSRLGYNATSVSEGLQVIEALEKKPYDIVILDIHMPGLTAMETTIQIRERWPDNPSIRIIGMSDLTYQEDVYQCLAVGMDGFLSKPFRIKQLRKLLE